MLNTDFTPWPDFSDEEAESYKISTKIDHSMKDEVVSTTELMAWKNENLQSSIKNFKCSRCGYDKAHLETRQTRSADEGMTHFLVCMKCGKMKKIGS